MNIKNLHFFDRNGYELNFNFNSTRNCWEGNIYLPPVSLGLYSNSTVFVLEEVEIPVENDSFKKHFKENETEKIYVFPRPSDKSNNQIVFTWDSQNSFVDEIFLFTFDNEYIAKRYTSLEYEYNNGPDCQTLLINRFDRYEINLDDKKLYFPISDKRSKRCLPIHVAFSSPVQFDANTYKRTLVMSCDNQEVARITYYAESIEEDERYKIWNYNLGYTLNPEDTIIFKESEIEEPSPNYVLLNEKRKELLIEGQNLYPYIGSYKAILGAIKFFGYDNLNIVEFWKNINPNDTERFGTTVMNPKYILSDGECTYVKSEIEFPNPDYRKDNKLALTYTINTPTQDVDLYELPYVKEDFKFSFGEVLIKLIALKNKLNKEFMPATSRIIDIIGEASYFGIQLLKNGFSFSLLKDKRKPIKMNIDSFPNRIVNITSDKFFNDFIFEKTGHSKSKNIEKVTVLDKIKDVQLSEIKSQIPTKKESSVNELNLTEEDKCELYRDYYKSINYTFINSEDVMDNDTYKVLEHVPTQLVSKHNEDYLTELGNNISAKVILENTTFVEKTFNDLPYPFKYIGNTFNDTRYLNDFQFDWEESIYDGKIVDNDVYLKWIVTYSKDQYDDNYNDNKRKEYYESVRDRYYVTGNQMFEDIFFQKDEHNELLKDENDKVKLKWKPRVEEQDIKLGDFNDKTKLFRAVKYGKLSETSQVLFELPYIGYYDVKLILYKNTISETTGEKVVVKNENEFKKYIKVEPHNIDIRGFYYDARENPNKVDMNMSDNEKTDMENFILNTLNHLTYLAKNDNKQRLKPKTYSEVAPGKYDLQVVMNKYLNKINEKEFYYDINNGPYKKQNFKFADYIIQDGEFIVDNINSSIVNLLPDLKTAKYIRNGVDVKPYTWIYLTFDYSKIVHRCNPVWKLFNHTTKNEITYEGRYFTCLLRDEGSYTITLELLDEFGNIYKAERNIVVVDEGANYKLYTPFINDYKAFKDYEDYKENIRFSALNDIEHMFDDDTGDYMFDFSKLKLYNKIECIKEIYGVTKRLTIEQGEGIGWGYDAPYDISSYDEFKLQFDRVLPDDDNLSIYFCQDPFTYYEYEIKTEPVNPDDDKITAKPKEIIIDVKSIKNINLTNISYIIFFNKNKDNNHIEVNIENIYFAYK